MDIFEWTEETPVTANNLNEMQNKLNDNATNYADENFSKIGKVLWEGSFTSGTIQVPHISEYLVICIFAGNLMMIGNQRYGGITFRTYRSTTTSSYGYRYTYNSANETLTTDTDNPGATDGANNIAITKIMGVF